MQLLTDSLLRELPAGPERKIVLFSDSRQDAAKLSTGIKLAHYRDTMRQIAFSALQRRIDNASSNYNERLALHRAAQELLSLEQKMNTEGLDVDERGRRQRLVALIPQAVGVILDGEAVPQCTPSRGSRFNSAMRYVRSPDRQRLAIVFSDDHTIDIIPLLRPQIDRHEVEKQITELEKATLENYHEPRNWLDDHRFYVNRAQCERVNRALDRIENLPKEMGQIVMITARLEPDPEFNESYFMPE